MISIFFEITSKSFSNITFQININNINKFLVTFENNLYVKLEKCEFDKSETTFLGYVKIYIINYINLYMVIVDRLTKMAHFIPFHCLPTASIAADAFLSAIFRLHGLPESIISDGGSQFTSAFWNRLYSLYDIDHSLSTVNHPQIDGQTERVNAILEQYLCCFINKRQNNWAYLLPFAEFSYNSCLQQSINQRHSLQIYGFNPKDHPEIPSNERSNSWKTCNRN